MLLGIFEGVGPQLILGGLAWKLSIIYIEIALGLAVAFAMWRSTSAAVIALSRQLLLGFAALAALTLVVPALRDAGISMVVPGIAQLKDVVAFSALVLVLVFKPTGLLGERLSSEDRG